MIIAYFLIVTPHRGESVCEFSAPPSGPESGGDFPPLS